MSLDICQRRMECTVAWLSLDSRSRQVAACDYSTSPLSLFVASDAGYISDLSHVLISIFLVCYCADPCMLSLKLMREWIRSLSSSRHHLLT